MLGISYLALQTPGFMALFLVLVFWDLMWKGIGLWKAARNEEKYWFIAILIINSLGIVPILYIYVFQKGKKGI
ncbi:DUF5652 family protein [uncultured Methanomethylovorans sp.]|uniref:DUF5652 family protein n=1 Tax=uncultured Methanomethylovorans sp. TaxID=183759 RepID=UPI002AA82A41|nr:DUF5652 family protein [uncultured Methanomethylovorans sp.]